MKKVVLITTGGTIASKPSTDTGLLESGVMTGEELTSLCDLPSDMEIVIDSIFQVPSMHITFNHLLRLKNRIEEHLKDENVAGIVVTHGTDSLEETAYFLDLTIDDPRTVAVTGSQRPPGVVGTDAYINIRHSVLVASNKEIRNFGTVVVFNERIFSARYVKKAHSSNPQGFTSFGYGYLGIIDNDVVLTYQRPSRTTVYQIKNDLPSVDIIKSYINSDGKFIRCAIDSGVKGIIIEGVGRGQVTPNMVDEITRGIKKGVYFVITTSAVEGHVFPAYDYDGSSYDLLTRGVILGSDYDAKKARLKLAVLLASEEEEIERNFKV
ncbi:asparaginase [Pseudalkalibacillus decolorationis]|uniref:asparaginase n=1 Tax=Pseudalkalibacillus decolorationis TaxID=163879 RepID=UPI0021481454|nr:asparaginase [Pseudalkalibacillus decolorationis]